MSGPLSDPSGILSRVGLWVAGLRERGQVDEATATRLNALLAESFVERLDEPDDPLLVVMLCGPTAVGKSSLINALAGAEISRPGFGAATRAAVLYVHERDDPQRLFAYSHALAGRDQADTQLVRHRRDELLHKVLVDTPDIDSVRLQHRELTARLVHAADLLLFVTSPEKYKVLRSARWVLEQRGQRALAFVLNKWDRSALGLQSDRRAAIEADFQTALADEGFADPVIFRLSTLAGAGDFENDLPALEAWLESGVSQSTATLLRHRRLRAAWGRLAAAIDAATPLPLSSHKLLPELRDTLVRRVATAEQGVVAEAAVLEPVGVEDAGAPATPGLLGMWTRLWQRAAAAGSSIKAGMSALARTPRAALPGIEGGFGVRPASALADAATQAAGDAAAQGMPLGPVGGAFAAAFAELDRQLAALPLDVAAELMLRAGRRSLRRYLGTAFVYMVEALILGVLLIAVARIATDFWTGAYSPGSLFLTVLMLVAILVVIGQTIGAMFFPPLRQRLRRLVAQRSRALVKTAGEQAGAALRAQVEAVDRLSSEGQDLLREIDRTLMTLATAPPAGADVERLFAEQNGD